MHKENTEKERRATGQVAPQSATATPPPPENAAVSHRRSASPGHSPLSPSSVSAPAPLFWKVNSEDRRVSPV